MFIFILLFCTPAFVTALQNTVKSYQAESDPVSYTFDLKYQYNIELINMSQRNNQVNLIVKDVSGEAEKKVIPLDLDTEEIIALTTGPGSNWQWALLEPTKN
ncbi:hypothetical protein [Paenibacillus sp. FSL H7-689]|uniref:hypothetical protein n=1 Tax=Paenibacillus sp. FSL H7-689 TaxID=1227349 RepID=UPI0003E23BDA|nr:hypothetical protein [Paenibacillus sp. FSL H7-689]ETT44827.1 hypothetical protein C170_23035 [Paenibacillus sp. FSL H7-689]